jgi:adenine/guanine phosphoribosyltransferase-like PRPP-binding protein
MDLRPHVRDIPNFPIPGIVFRDITPLLLDRVALDAAVECLAERVSKARVDFVAAAEIHDDLLATGGTARASCDLVVGLGGEIVGCAFLVELSFLSGRARLARHPVHALIEYSS